MSIHVKFSQTVLNKRLEGFVSNIHSLKPQGEKRGYFPICYMYSDSHNVKLHYNQKKDV